MSVELIRSITVKKGEVHVTCASSNVFPRTYHTIVDEKGTQELKEDGLELVLRSYASSLWTGTYRITGTSSKICAVLKRCLTYLRNDAELSAFLDEQTAGDFIARMATANLERKDFDSEAELEVLRGMRHSFEYVMQIGKRNPSAFEAAAPEIRNNREYALTFAQEYANLALFNIPALFRDDLEIVRTCLERNGCLYRQLEGSIAGNEEIIRLAFRETYTAPDGTVRRFHEHLPDLLPEKVRQDKSFLAELVQICPSLHADRLPILYKDYELACLVARHNRWARSTMGQFPTTFMDRAEFQEALEQGDRMRAERTRR